MEVGPKPTRLAARMLIPGLAIVLAWFAPGARSARVDSATGIALALCGVAAIVANRRSRSGDLLGLAAVSWFAGNFMLAASPLLGAVGERTVFLHRAVLAHTAVTLPSGRAQRWTWIALAAIYLLALMPSMQRSHEGALLWAAIVMATAIADLAQRSVASNVDWVTTLAVTGLLAGTVAGELHGDAYRIAIVLVGLAAAGVCVGAARRRARWSESVGELIHGPDPAVRAAFVAALGDPNVRVAFADIDGWVDEFGRPVAALTAGPGQHVSELEVDGRPIAAVAHATELAADPAFARALARAAALAADHVRLWAEIRRATGEVAASRSRVATEAGLARTRFASAVRDGADALLEAISSDLSTLGDRVCPAATALDSIRGEIDTLLAGLGPLATAGGQLVPALLQLGERSPLAVELDLEPGVDLGGAAAETLWFVAAEGLTNVAKHTECTTARLILRSSDETTTIEVIDTGRGGADRDAGSGLQGLADRVATIGGNVSLESSPLGTRLAATVPTVHTSPMRIHGSP